MGSAIAKRVHAPMEQRIMRSLISGLQVYGGQ